MSHWAQAYSNACAQAGSPASSAAAMRWRRKLAALPLGDGLLVDPEALGREPEAFLTMLYRLTDRCCRCGASVETPAHSVSVHSREKIAL